MKRCVLIGVQIGAALLISVLNLNAQVLQAGDANLDSQVDSSDLVTVVVGGKYLTGLAADWSEGDWNGAPGGSPGNPPPGNGLFDQQDIVAFLFTGLYLTGPYTGTGPSVPAPGPSAILSGGVEGDDQTSVIYDPFTGEVSVDPPASGNLTSIHLISNTGRFTGDPANGLTGLFDVDMDSSILKAVFGESFGATTFGNVAETGLTENQILTDFSVTGSLDGGGSLGPVDLVYIAPPVLQAGDANLDFAINSSDLVAVFTAGKYLSGLAADWSEGDWDGAPGGSQGTPPSGNGLFDEQDIVAILFTGLYETGTYIGTGPSVPAPGPSAMLPGGVSGDGQTSVVYYSNSGEISIDPPSSSALSSIHLISNSGFFTGEPALNLGGLFDVDDDHSVFKADFSSAIGAITFGAIASAGLTEGQLLADLSVNGSLQGGGSIGPVDLILPVIFADGFENGDLTGWSSSQAVNRAPELLIDLTWTTPGDPVKGDPSTAVLRIHGLQAPDGGGPHSLPELTDGRSRRRVGFEAPRAGQSMRVGAHAVDDAGFGASFASMRLFHNGSLVDEISERAMSEGEVWLGWEIDCVPGGALVFRRVDTVSASPD